MTQNTPLHVLGIDIGGTKIAIGVLNSKGELLGSERFPTCVDKGPEYALDMMESTSKDLIGKLKVDPGTIKATGVGVAGPLDAEKGLVLSPPNLYNWEELPLRAELERRLGFRMWMANDADAAALGEFMFGAGTGSRYMVYMTISTGIGGGLVIDGDLYSGASCNATEVGHMTINFGGRPCGCGSRGCLEAYASGPSIAKRAQEKLPKHKDSLVFKMAEGKVKNINAALIAEACRQGDAFAKGIMDDTAFYLGVGIANVVNIFNPDRVVLGGGVSNSFDLLISGIWDVVRERTMSASLPVMDIVKAQLGGDIGIFGAGGLALRREGLL